MASPFSFNQSHNFDRGLSSEEKQSDER